VDVDKKDKLLAQGPKGDWDGFQREVTLLTEQQSQLMMIVGAALAAYTEAMDAATEAFTADLQAVDEIFKKRVEERGSVDDNLVATLLDTVAADTVKALKDFAGSEDGMKSRVESHVGSIAQQNEQFGEDKAVELDKQAGAVASVTELAGNLKDSVNLIKTTNTQSRTANKQ
jgi:hypothetical protein